VVSVLPWKVIIGDPSLAVKPISSIVDPLYKLFPHINCTLKAFAFNLVVNFFFTRSSPLHAPQMEHTCVSTLFFPPGPFLFSAYAIPKNFSLAIPFQHKIRLPFVDVGVPFASLREVDGPLSVFGIFMPHSPFSFFFHLGPFESPLCDDPLYFFSTKETAPPLHPRNDRFPLNSP